MAEMTTTGRARTRSEPLNETACSKAMVVTLLLARALAVRFAAVEASFARSWSALLCSEAGIFQ